MARTSRRQRAIRLMRWGGLLLCAILLGLWAVSALYDFVYVHPRDGWSFYIRLTGGQVYLVSQSVPFFPPASYRLRLHRTPLAVDWAWDVRLISFKDWVIILPVWVPLLAAVAATVVAFWPWRRRLPGHCPRCGYNLAGNTSGICPECGRAAASGGAGRAS